MTVMVRKKTKQTRSVKVSPARKTTDRGDQPRERVTEFDTHLGTRVRERRMLLGWSQTRLAEMIGVTFQQLQKYEMGRNRISASRLQDIADAMKVSTSYFYEDYKPAIKPVRNRKAYTIGLADNDQEPYFPEDLSSDKGAREILRLYYGMQDTDARKNLVNVVKNVARITQASEEESSGRSRKKTTNKPKNKAR